MKYDYRVMNPTEVRQFESDEIFGEGSFVFGASENQQLIVDRVVDLGGARWESTDTDAASTKTVLLYCRAAPTE
jgi:hypothetical protein